MKDIIVFDNQDITKVGMEALVLTTKKASSVLFVDNKSDLIRMLISKPESAVVLDYTLSDFTGIDELLNLGYRYPKVRWYLFSEELSYDFLRRVTISSEMYSIVLKSCDLDEINIGLIHLFRDERFICGRVSNLLLQPQRVTVENVNKILTATEKEVLKEIALGKTTKEIASSRNLSVHTVITHRKNIFRKLEVNNSHEAVKYAMRAGLVDLAEYYI